MKNQVIVPSTDLYKFKSCQLQFQLIDDSKQLFNAEFSEFDFTFKTGSTSTETFSLSSIVARKVALKDNTDIKLKDFQNKLKASRHRALLGKQVYQNLLSYNYATRLPMLRFQQNMWYHKDDNQNDKISGLMIENQSVEQMYFDLGKVKNSLLKLDVRMAIESSNFFLTREHMDCSSRCFQTLVQLGRSLKDQRVNQRLALISQLEVDSALVETHLRIQIKHVTLLLQPLNRSESERNKNSEQTKQYDLGSNAPSVDMSTVLAFKMSKIEIYSDLVGRLPISTQRLNLQLDPDKTIEVYLFNGKNRISTWQDLAQRYQTWLADSGFIFLAQIKGLYVTQSSHDVEMIFQNLHIELSSDSALVIQRLVSEIVTAKGKVSAPDDRLVQDVVEQPLIQPLNVGKKGVTYPVYSFEGVNCERKQFLSSFKNLSKDFNYFEQKGQKETSPIAKIKPFSKDHFKGKESSASKRLTVGNFTLILKKEEHLPNVINPNPVAQQLKIVRSKSHTRAQYEPVQEVEVDGFVNFGPPLARCYTTKRQKRVLLRLTLSEIEIFDETFPSGNTNQEYETLNASIKHLNLVFQNDGSEVVSLQRNPKNQPAFFCDLFSSSVTENSTRYLLIQLNLRPIIVRITKDMTDFVDEFLRWHRPPEPTKNLVSQRGNEQQEQGTVLKIVSLEINETELCIDVKGFGHLYHLENFKLYPATFRMPEWQQKSFEQAYETLWGFYSSQLADKKLIIILRFISSLKSVRAIGKSLVVLTGPIYKPLIGVRQGRAGVVTGLREGVSELTEYLLGVCNYFLLRETNE